MYGSIDRNDPSPTAVRRLKKALKIPHPRHPRLLPLLPFGFEFGVIEVADTAAGDVYAVPPAVASGDAEA